MIVGDRQRFAIEAEPTDAVDGWVFGHFRFWLGGVAVGNWDDAADLRGCTRWLDDFATRPRNRFEPALERLPAADVVRVAYDEVMHPGEHASTEGGKSISDASGRFHISYLGMSAFDAVDILLLSMADGSERCIWRDARSGAISECRLGPDEMECVAAEFCRSFNEELTRWA